MASAAWDTVYAPSEIHLECAKHSELFIAGNVSHSLCRPCDLEPFSPHADWRQTIGERDVCCSLRVQCTNVHPEGTEWFPQVSHPTLAEVARDGSVDPEPSGSGKSVSLTTYIDMVEGLGARILNDPRSHQSA